MLFYQNLSQNLISLLFVYLVTPPIIHVKSCWEYCYFFEQVQESNFNKFFHDSCPVKFFLARYQIHFFVFVGYRINLFQHVLGFECSMQSSFSSVSQLLNLTKKKKRSKYFYFCTVYGVHNFHQKYQENPRRPPAWLSIRLASIKNSMYTLFRVKHWVAKKVNFIMRLYYKSERKEWVEI